MRFDRVRPRPRGDGGMVTAELAACLPVLVLMLAAAISAVAVVSARVHAQDAAREAVRAAARDDSAAARRLAGRAAPGAQVSIIRGGDEVTARIRLRVEPLGDLFPAVTVSADAVAAVEPSR